VVEETWPGKWPQLFFNGTIGKQARIDGETDVAAYYIRTGHNVLFMRMQRDNFATEYTGNPAPGKPLYLLKSTEISGFIHELTAVDSGFRMMRVRTDAYPQPIHVEPVDPFIPQELDEAASAGMAVMGGEYLFVVYSPPPTGDTSTPGFLLAGAYTSEIISPPTQSDSAAVGFGVPGGAYESTAPDPQYLTETLSPVFLLAGAYTVGVIIVPAITENGSLAAVASGSYDQTIFDPRTHNETASPSLTVTGTYGP
jgi:hypothetical protein